MNFKKKFFYLIFTTIFSLLLLFSFSVLSYGWGDPEIVTKINSAFESIENWLIKISTPATAVAVGSGVFMRKYEWARKLLKGLYFLMLLYLLLI